MTPVDPERAQPEAPGKLFKDDTRFALGRIAVFQYLAVGVFLLLISGFWILQVRDHESNSELAERNRIKTVPLLAPRGKILDRDGRVIVDSHSVFTVMLSRENSQARAHRRDRRRAASGPRRDSRAAQALFVASEICADHDQAGADPGRAFLRRIASRPGDVSRAGADPERSTACIRATALPRT